MNINDLIQLTETRLSYLTVLLNDATRLGDVEAITSYTNKINETQNTLNALKSLT